MMVKRVFAMFGLMLALLAPVSAGLAAGYVTGPASSTVGDVAIWNNTTGSSVGDMSPSALFTGIMPLPSLTANSFGVTAHNASFNANANDLQAIANNCTFDWSSGANIGYIDENCVELAETVSQGLALYGGGTSAKFTYIPLLITANYAASGQKNIFGFIINCYGMSDCSAGQEFVTYAGGPISGDEGQAFENVSLLTQQPTLTTTTITSVPTATSCNTTVTQTVTASPSVQTVTVASTTGCNANDWVVLNTQGATGSPNQAAMQITGVGAGTISGIFRANMTSGSGTITPARVLNVGSTGTFGQDRVLVDHSGTTYATGTISSISGYTLAGSATSWSNAMVGGSAKNPGCVAMTADNYTGSPFSSGSPLASWFEIISVNSATGLSIFSYSTSGDPTYQGKGPGSGAYEIQPCARVLLVVNTTQIVLNTNSFAWNAGDSIEQAIVPYADVTGHQWHLAGYTNGGSFREGLDIRNVGARQFGSGILIDASQPSGADSFSWGNGVAVQGGGGSAGAVRNAFYSSGNNAAFNSQYDTIGMEIQYDAFGLSFLGVSNRVLYYDNIPTIFLEYYNGTYTGEIPGGTALTANRTWSWPDASGTFTVLGNTVTGSGGTIVKAGSPTIATPIFSGLTTGTNADFLCLSSTGAVLIQSSACTISDVNLKEHITDGWWAFIDLMKLHPKAYRLKGDPNHPNGDPNFRRPQLGLTAQNVDEVDPRLAIVDVQGKPKTWRPEAVIALLVEGFHEQAAIIGGLVLWNMGLTIYVIVLFRRRAESRSWAHAPSPRTSVARL
jgi:hypothetical protein